MVRYNKANPPSEQTQAEAMAIARSTQKPGQTKEQTKLIAQGVQKGIELYKKQQKAKARERDKQQKRASVPAPSTENSEPAASVSSTPATQGRLPWVLLLLSWALFAAYIVLS